MKNIQEVVVAAQEAFWAKVAEMLPEVKSGDFPPDAQFRFAGACEDAVRVWISANMPREAFSEEDLESIGFKIFQKDGVDGFFFAEVGVPASSLEDVDEFGPYSTLDEARDIASDDAQSRYDLSRCDNCGKLHTDVTVRDAKNLSMRTDPGGEIPAGECVECGALCYILD